MPFLRQSQLQKFTPRSVKFEDIYKHGLKTKKLSNTDRLNAQKALAKVGLNSTEVSKMMAGKEMSVLQAKNISQKLSVAGLSGFEQDRKMVSQFVKGEALRKKNIAGRRAELMQESLQEEMYQAGRKGSAISKTTTKKTPGKMSKPTLKF